MKYCVYCAAYCPDNEESINCALKAKENIEFMWDLNADATYCYEGSDITVNEHDGNNISIWVEDENIYRLLYSCMAFAYELERLKHVK